MAITFTMEDGSGQAVSDWMLDVYGLHIPGDYSVQNVSEDGKTILGWMVRESAMGLAYYPWYVRLN